MNKGESNGGEFTSAIPPAAEEKSRSAKAFDKQAVVCGDCVDTTAPNEVAPVDRLVIPSDVATFNVEDAAVNVIGTREGKVTKIRGLENMKKLKSLVLRSCLISKMEGLESLESLEKLELYDNHVESIENISTLSKLKVLDLSFNAIRELVPLAESCPLLEEVYAAQNKLRKIEGLEGLVHLRTLDLGANRIRKIEGLETNTALQSLWLGKNKIEAIEGLGALTQLRQLDVQHNRLTEIGSGIAHLTVLEELYLAWNAIEKLVGLPRSEQLNTVDLTKNNISIIDQQIAEHPSLEELWLSSNSFDSFDSIKPLTMLPKLTCLYLEHSPLSKDFEYRITVTRWIPSLQQLDATAVNRSASPMRVA